MLSLHAKSRDWQMQASTCSHGRLFFADLLREWRTQASTCSQASSSLWPCLSRGLGSPEERVRSGW